MWIELPIETIEEIKGVKSPLDNKILAINAIFTSMLNLQHIVFAHNKVLNSLLENDYINLSNKHLIHWIKGHYNDVYSGKDLFTYKIYVDFKNTEISKIENSFFVPFRYMLQISKTMLLTENEADAKIFECIYRYIYPRGYYDVHYCNRAFHGGNVVSCMDEAIREKSFVLCLVDSDREYKGGGRGSTSSGAHNLFNSIKDKNVIELWELNVREKENLFPPNFYKAVLEDEYTVILDILNNFINNEDVIRYVNIKDGIKYKWLIKNDNIKYRIWRENYANFVNMCKSRGAYIEPTDNLNDKEKEKFNCIKGIGGNSTDKVKVLLYPEGEEYTILFNSLSDAQKDIVDLYRKDLKSILPKYLKDDWESIARLFLSWCGSLASDNMTHLRG